MSQVSDFHSNMIFQKRIESGLKMGKLIFKDIFRPSMVLDNKKED